MELDLLIHREPAPDDRMEICRSFSYRLNLENAGGPRYEHLDFFASRKMEVAFRDRHWLSEMLYQECAAEVTQAVAKAKAKIQRKVAQREEAA